MNPWCNIEVLSNDQEILAIDQLEQTLNNIPYQVYKVRELITRFEVCHFKYQKHYQHIIDSITAQNPTVNVDIIGANHLRHGEKVINNDKTTRSLTGFKYIKALGSWMENKYSTLDESQKSVDNQVVMWLNERSNVKKRLVSMLIDRLFYRPLEKYFSCGEISKLEYQVIATDICNYSFPQNIEKMIKGIGKLETIKEFHGCGTTTPEIETFITNEFHMLCKWLKKDIENTNSRLGEKNQIKTWLVFCLIKTLKEQIHLSIPIPYLVI